MYEARRRRQQAHSRGVVLPMRDKDMPGPWRPCSEPETVPCRNRLLVCYPGRMLKFNIVQRCFTKFGPSFSTQSALLRLLGWISVQIVVTTHTRMNTLLVPNNHSITCAMPQKCVDGFMVSQGWSHRSQRQRFPPRPTKCVKSAPHVNRAAVPNGSKLSIRQVPAAEA